LNAWSVSPAPHSRLTPCRWWIRLLNALPMGLAALLGFPHDHGATAIGPVFRATRKVTPDAPDVTPEPDFQVAVPQLLTYGDQHTRRNTLAIRITAAREPRERTNHRVKYRISGRFQGLRLTVRLIEELSPIGWIVRDEWTHFPVPLLAHRCIRTVPLSRAVCIQHYAKLGIEIISGDDGRPVPYDDDVELIEDVRGDAGENGGMGRDFVHNDYGMRINGLELHFPPPK
jgi:hypothetical protein